MAKISIEQLCNIASTQQIALLGDVSAFEFMLDYNEKNVEYDRMISLLFSDKKLRNEYHMISDTQILFLFQSDVKSILTLNFEKYVRYLSIHNATYNPIENYDRKEDIYERNQGLTEKRNGTINHDTVMNGSETTTYNHGRASATNTSSQTPYDSNNFKATAKNDVVNEAFTDSDTLAYDNRTNSTTDNYTNLSNEIDVEKMVDGHIHGNIGVTTNQQMLSQEVDFWKNFNLLKIIFTDIVTELTEPFWEM